MTSRQQPLTITRSRNANDILLDLFVERTLGSLDHELDDWSDGITDIALYEDNVLLNRRASWNYFAAENQSPSQRASSSIPAPSNVIPFPSSSFRLSA